MAGDLFDDFDFDADLEENSREESNSSEPSDSSDEVSPYDFGGDFGGSFEEATSAPEEVKDESKSVKKAAILLGIAGFAVVVIVFIIASSVKNGSKPSNPAKESENVAASSQITVTSNTNWIELSSKDKVTVKEALKGTFTVAEVKSYARVTDGTNHSIQTKSIVKGTIGGLVGLYEIEIPYDKALYLGIGNTFEVEYDILTAENMKSGAVLVGEVRY